jgi:serine protease
MPDRSEAKSSEESKSTGKGYPTRIVVKFDDELSLPYEAGAERALEGEMRKAWEQTAEKFPGITLQPLYDDEDTKNLSSLVERARENDPNYVPANFLTYFVIQMPAGFDGSSLAQMLSAMPSVETAYVEAGPVDPPVNAVNDPRFSNQGYLMAAPRGIDAIYAWTQPGGDGLGVLFVDLERGWTLNHEDLLAVSISLISGMNQDWFGHGTAVLGEVVAVDNMLGGVGIAPQAWAQVVSQWRNGGSYNTSAAIASASAVMTRGDILLLEAQTTANGFTNIPVEVEQATFDAIRLAIGAGIVVVEAAGNGGNDLDTYTNASGEFILNRTHRDFQDSGAIVVGGALSGVPHRRWAGSCFGSRIDCYGWAENIDTAGNGYTLNNPTIYTSNFGGTSGASAMLAGAAVLVQSLSFQFRRRRYSPSGLRALLSDPARGTASADPVNDRIGVMPDLRAIIDGVLNRPPQSYPLDIYRTLVQILFGVINDAPGVVIGPDGKPIPVGPWDPTAIRLAAEHVDWLTGMALTEFAKIIRDEASAKEVRQAGLAAMERALNHLKEG